METNTCAPHGASIGTNTATGLATTEESIHAVPAVGAVCEGIAAEPTPDAPHAVEREVIYLPIDQIVPPPAPLRESFAEKGIAELAETIRAYGILQPLVVRLVGAMYEIIAGHRRYLAAKLAGPAMVPAAVATADDAEGLQMAVVENIQRERLSMMEEARALGRMRDALGLSVRALAEKTGKGKGRVDERLQLLHLPEDLVAMVCEHPKTGGHAVELARLPDADARAPFVKRILAGKLSVKDLRGAVKALLTPDAGAEGKADAASDGQTPTAAHAAGQAGAQETTPAPPAAVDPPASADESAGSPEATGHTERAQPAAEMAAAAATSPAAPEDGATPVMLHAEGGDGDMALGTGIEASHEGEDESDDETDQPRDAVENVMEDLHELQRHLLAVGEPAEPARTKLYKEMHDTLEMMLRVMGDLEDAMAA